MLTKIRNVLAGITLPALPAEPPSPSPDADTIAAEKKQKELAQEKTAAQVDRLRSDLATAQLTLTQAETAEGQSLVDGLDVTAATEARRHASDSVRVLESAVTIALQKDEAAQAELQQAERQLADVAQNAAIETAMELGVQLGMLHNQVKRERLKLASALKVLVMNGGITQLSANEIMDQHDFYAKIALRSPAADQADSGSFRKYRSLYHCIGYLCGRADP